jgi:hypothetical protein
MGQKKNFVEILTARKFDANGEFFGEITCKIEESKFCKETFEEFFENVLKTKIFNHGKFDVIQEIKNNFPVIVSGYEKGSNKLTFFSFKFEIENFYFIDYHKEKFARKLFFDCGNELLTFNEKNHLESILYFKDNLTEFFERDYKNFTIKNFLSSDPKGNFVLKQFSDENFENLELIETYENNECVSTEYVEPE